MVKKDWLNFSVAIPKIDELLLQGQILHHLLSYILICVPYSWY